MSNAKHGRLAFRSWLFSPDGHSWPLDATIQREEEHRAGGLCVSCEGSPAGRPSLSFLFFSPKQPEPKSRRIQGVRSGTAETKEIFAWRELQRRRREGD